MAQFDAVFHAVGLVVGFHAAAEFGDGGVLRQFDGGYADGQQYFHAHFTGLLGIAEVEIEGTLVQRQHAEQDIADELGLAHALAGQEVLVAVLLPFGFEGIAVVIPAVEAEVKKKFEGKIKGKE